MGACCGSKVDDEADRKFARDGDKDISNGPVTSRGCTDIPCLIIFLLHWVVFIVISFAGAQDGNPSKLWKPRDFRGDYCGTKTQWNNGLNLENQEQRTYTMNVTATVDLTAKQLVCSTIAETELQRLQNQGTLTSAELSTYRCACCKDACSSCYGSLAITDLTSTSQLSSTISGKMTEFVGNTSATNLFSANGFNGDFMSNVWKEANKYFNAVCLPKCTSPHVNTSSSTRTYTYQPSPEIPWKRAWTVLSDTDGSFGVNQVIRDTIATKFTFKAIDSTTCPYPAKYCIPFPGVTFEELTGNLCTFKMATDVVNSIGTSASQAYADLGANSLVNSMTETFGDAFGDFMKTLDTFAVVCALSFVIGFVFLTLLRFLVGFVVWTSIFGVFFVFGLSGAFMYVRSNQCAGAGLFESGKHMAVATGSAIAGMSSSADETMTGNGKDYRGVQHITQTGKSCQAWSAQTPHTHSWTSSTVITNSGLTSNYCRNPESAPTIWCYTTDPTVRWELCTPIGVIAPNCPQGYMVSSKTWRDILKVMAWIMWIFGLLWLLLVCCFCYQIRLAIAINKVAARFISSTPSVLLVPIVQIGFAIAWFFIWALCASFLLSQVPESYTPTDYYRTWEEAMGTSNSKGKCNDKAISGGAWKYEGDLTSTNDPCSGNLGNIAGIIPHCFRCYPPRFIVDIRFGISGFSYLWNAAFLIAVGQCTIAGAVGVWFFTKSEERRNALSVRTGLRNCFRYHTGSLAFGSFILAVVQFLRYVCKYLEMQAAAQKNKVAVIVAKILQCFLWCVEKCIKFLNKNAYIQIALLGKNFCISAKNAAMLWVRNLARFSAVAILGAMIHFLGYVFIMSATTILGYFILQAMHSDVIPVFPVLAYIALSYLVAVLFMNVFGLSVDTLLHCFFAAEEMGSNDTTPPELKKFMKDSSRKDDDDEDIEPVDKA